MERLKALLEGLECRELDDILENASPDMLRAIGFRIAQAAKKDPTIRLCQIVADQKEAIDRLGKKLDVQVLVNRAQYARIDAFEDFYMEATERDPTLGEIADRNKVDTSEFMDND